MAHTMRLATLGPHYTRARHTRPFTVLLHPFTTPSRSAGTRHYYRVQGRVHVQGGRRKHVVPRCALQGRQAHAHAHAMHMHPQPLPLALALALPLPSPPISLCRHCHFLTFPSLCRHCYLGPWPHRFADAKSAAVRETRLPRTSSTPARAHTPRTRFSAHTSPIPKSPMCDLPSEDLDLPATPPLSIPMMAGLLRQGGEGARAQGGAAG